MKGIPTCTVRFDALGRETTNVTSYRIQQSYMTSTDQFEVTLYERDIAKRRGLELQPVSILIDGNVQMMGRIERTEIGANGLELSISGRDYLSDMVECCVDPALKIKENTTLAQAIIDAAKPVGITTVKDDCGKALRNLRTGASVKGKASGGIKDKQEDEYKPQPGEGIFEFCNRLAARQGATIQPTDDRSAVSVAAPDYTQEQSFLLVRSITQLSGAGSNIESATATRDYSRFPTFTMATGKVGRGEKKSSLGYEIKAGGFPTNDLIHEGRIKPGENPSPPSKHQLYRLFYLRDEQAKSKEELERSCKRAWSERTKDVLQYHARISTGNGHRDIATGRTFAADTMVRVSDELTDVDELLWIESVSFSYDDSSGPITEVTCWLPGAFVI